MPLKEITVHQLNSLIESGDTRDALIIDIRTPGEFRAGRIPGSVNIPHEALQSKIEELRTYRRLFIHCNSGNFSSIACQQLRQLGLEHHIDVLGGALAWEEAGFAMNRDKGAMPIFRQVMAVAGSMVTIGMILSWLISPYFLIIPAFVGAGLTVSGFTGFCAMARLLAKMPWNTRAGAPIDNSSLAATTAMGAAMSSAWRADCSSPTSGTRPVSNCGAAMAKPSCGQTGADTSAATNYTSPSGSFTVQQFIDTDLAHFSYAIISQGEMAVVDPMRDPRAYYNYAREKNARITAIFETHPHADFVSGHLQIAQETGAIIYAHSLVSAEYPHRVFDDGARVDIGQISLRSLHTPGHSPDSITIALDDETGVTRAIFSGDTLFVGDVGRPDLREKTGAVTGERRELAKAMYRSTRETLMPLPPETLVYPAHGAGTLCGKNLSKDTYSVMSRETATNPALRKMSETEFVNFLTSDQPHIPKYFPHSVDLNKRGATAFATATASAPIMKSVAEIPAGALVIDTRPKSVYEQSTLPNSVNINSTVSYCTWLGSLVSPGEPFYLVAESDSQLRYYIERTAAIGYETQIAGALVYPLVKVNLDGATPALFSKAELSHNPERFTIVDVRNEGEIAAQPIFANALHIPLHELRERLGEIAEGKPIVTYCDGGFRAAIAASLIKNRFANVVDIGELS